MAELEIAKRSKTPRRDKPHRDNKMMFKALKRDIFLRTIGVFLAMAVPVPGIAPFGLSFLAQERKWSIRGIISLIMISLGSILACDRVGAAKYIGAGVIYISALFVLEKGIKVSEITAGIIASGAVILSGLVTMYWQGITVSNFLLLLCEAATVMAGALVIDRGRMFLFDGEFAAEKLMGDEKLSIGAICAILLMSLKALYIGADFSIMNSAAALVLLIIALGCGVGYSTGAGVLLGLVCGMGTDYFMPVLGAFSFCGFLSGVFSKFGKGGVVAGLILANAMLIVYTNGALKSMLTLYEIMVSSVLFMFVPSRIVAATKSLFCLKESDRENIVKVKEGIKVRLRTVAASFETMSKTLARLSDKENNADITDVATMFDLTADKICKNCRKATVCWGEGFNSTYKSMFSLLEIMEKKGTVDTDDVQDHFKAKCVNLTKLLGELNTQFDVYQVKRVWKSKLGESRELVGEQLFGVSKIIDDLAEEIENDMSFDTVFANDIRARLEGKGIKIRDISVIQNKNGKARVEMTLKKSYLKEKTILSIKNVMRSVFGGGISMHETVLDDLGLVRLNFAEEERFDVEIGRASAVASEKSGDNYRFSHLSNGKYIIMLSDGMGTGERASRESEAMIELLDSFLQAGFDSRVAVRLINSIMIMKSENEAFVTIDMCIIDLYTGETEFIKTGAEPSFIMHKNNVETVRASSLPIGVVAGVEADVISHDVDEGDIIVMVTDGVETKEDGNKWIKEFIGRNRNHAGVEELANCILNHAVEKNGGAVGDDMTVLSVRIKKKRERALIA